MKKCVGVTKIHNHGIIIFFTLKVCRNFQPIKYDSSDHTMHQKTYRFRNWWEMDFLKIHSENHFYISTKKTFVKSKLGDFLTINIWGNRFELLSFVWNICKNFVEIDWYDSCDTTAWGHLQVRKFEKSWIFRKSLSI